MKGRKNPSSGRDAANGPAAMAEKTGIDQIVEKVVSQVLESQIPPLREELVRRVLEEIQPQLAQAPAAATDGATPANLLKAILAIHAGTTQREILRALLDNTVRYSGRAALFVIKAGAATGWQGRGLDKNDDAVKDFALDVNTGVASRAMQSRMAFTGATSEIDPQFVAQFGAAADDQVLVLPLLLKDKIAALVYADAGAEPGGKMDAAALEVLVAATSAWLEVTSLRKQALKEGTADAAGVEKPEAPPPVQTVSSFSDPFASHTPKHVVEPPPSEVGEPAVAPAMAEAEPVSMSSAAAAAPAPAADTFAQLPPEEADVHRKAQRFARLLVDEIKLYNQVKMTEGRKNKDLYDRLKEDIEKSRATYQKRYGNTVAASADYFTQEVVRSLAEDDSSIMGANFRR
jgi:hypothetical protein